MVSLPYSVGRCEKARNYNGLVAIASLHVDLSKELQWFRCRRLGLGTIGFWSVPGASGKLPNRPRACRRSKVLQNDHPEEGNQH